MRKKVNFDKYNSLLGENAVVEGNITVKDSTRIDGTVHGNVVAQGAVILGAKAEVDGDITASDVGIGGKVVGDITVKGKTVISATANIQGNITTKCLVIDENAVFQGNCNMSQIEGSFNSSIDTTKAAE